MAVGSGRRGNYSLMFGVTLVAVIGFSALAVDITWVSMSQAEGQAVADAASLAGLIEYRMSDDEDSAEDRIAQILDRNTVANGNASIVQVDFGTWDGASFGAPDGDYSNAVSVDIQRAGAPYLLGRILGHEQFDVNSSAVAATDPLCVSVVVDTTMSFGASDFDNARAAALVIYDTFDNFGEEVTLSLVQFQGQYAWDTSPPRTMDDHVAQNARANEWATLSLSSYAGRQHAGFNKWNCHRVLDDYYYPYSGYSWGWWTNNIWNDYDADIVGSVGFPVGGCHPDAWRRYTDEGGTDQSVGMERSATHLEACDDDLAYKAMVVLTDGRPEGTAISGIRPAQSYNESRWNYIAAGETRSRDTVISRAHTIAENAFSNDEVNVWVVSVVMDVSDVSTVPRGDGYFVYTADSNELVPIFTDIAESLATRVVD